MILYHGSYTEIKKPDLKFSRERTDFGKGFYLTPLKAQAVSWAERFLRTHGTAVVSIYAYLPNDNDTLPQDVRVLEFDAYSIEWLRFIAACRSGQKLEQEWDLVIGGVANDKVFDTLQLYFDELISADEAIGRLRYDKPNLQYCFKTQALIDTQVQFTGLEALP